MDNIYDLVQRRQGLAAQQLADLTTLFERFLLVTPVWEGPVPNWEEDMEMWRKAARAAARELGQKVETHARRHVLVISIVESSRTELQRKSWDDYMDAAAQATRTAIDSMADRLTSCAIVAHQR